MNATAEPVARLQGVSLRYGATCAVDAVDLSIPARCMVGLIGPDGVGKSSLLALIAGARQIQAGSVEVLDEARGLSRVFAIGEPIAQQGIAKQKTPERLTIVDELPRNASGKILKHELRNLPL